jgi:hypothetical protein
MRRRAAGVAPDQALPHQVLLGARQYEIIRGHQKRPGSGSRCGSDAAKQ